MIMGKARYRMFWGLKGRAQNCELYCRLCHFLCVSTSVISRWVTASIKPEHLVVLRTILKGPTPMFSTCSALTTVPNHTYTFIPTSHGVSFSEGPKGLAPACVSLVGHANFPYPTLSTSFTQMCFRLPLRSPLWPTGFLEMCGAISKYLGIFQIASLIHYGVRTYFVWFLFFQLC